MPRREYVCSLSDSEQVTVVDDERGEVAVTLYSDDDERVQITLPTWAMYEVADRFAAEARITVAAPEPFTLAFADAVTFAHEAGCSLRTVGGCWLIVGPNDAVANFVAEWELRPWR